MAKGKRRQGWREVRRRGGGVCGGVRAGDAGATALSRRRRERQRRQAEPEHRGGDEPSAGPMFVPVRLGEHDPPPIPHAPPPAWLHPAAPIEIILPGGCRVRVSGPVDRRALADVLAALDGTAAGDAREVRPC